MYKQRRLIALCSLLCLILFSPTIKAREVILMNGERIELPEKTNRVACLFGPSFEKVLLLGAEHKIVLVSNFSQSMWPWAGIICKRVSQVPVLDSYINPKPEELLKMDLDVVFFWNKPDSIRMMNNVGIPVIAPNSIIGSRFEDRKALLMLYAQALGPEEEKVAQDYCAYFDAKLRIITSVTSRIPASERPTVYFAVRKPLMTGGKTSILPSIVDAAGGECVTKDLNMNFGQMINMEQLLAWNPDVIVMDHCSISSLSSGPAEENMATMIGDERFNHIEAVKQRRMYISPTGVFFWDSGQQVILQVMWLAKILHPERFEDIDMVKELQYFYTTFFRYNLTEEEATRILLHLPPLH